jgi:hypothetical protein
MLETLSLTLRALLSWPVITFVAGVAIGSTTRRWTVPPRLVKLISYYLIVAIGFKGGQELANGDASHGFVVAALLGVAFSFFTPPLIFGLLRWFTRLGVADRIALGAALGSVSLVTFVTATTILEDRGISFDGYWVAVMALMEAPALLSALWLKQKFIAKGRSLSWSTLRPVLLCESTLVLYLSLALGFALAVWGWREVSSVITTPFKWVLCLFLAELGLRVGRSFLDLFRRHRNLVTFGCLYPLGVGTLTVALAATIGFDVGGCALLAVLSASASYIVVPAALRISLPEADPSIYVSLAISIVFPFNLIFGIPTYLTLAQWLAG